MQKMLPGEGNKEMSGGGGEGGGDSKGESECTYCCWL